MPNLNINLKKFTWDHPDKIFSEEEFLQSPEFISRILKYGDIKNWVWVISKLGRKGMINFIKHYGYKLDDRTFNWWRTYYGFDDTLSRTERGIGEIKKIGPF
ncbi:MAG: hypothetical protein U9N08_03650 [Candidatus Caldatribacteriota bacterium]|nr:hypothetical protein [Candidatus Caldatribacteriota bacterium]